MKNSKMFKFVTVKISMLLVASPLLAAYPPGVQEWTSLPLAGGATISSSPVVDGGIIFVGSTNTEGSFQALSVNGENQVSTLWQYSTGGPIYSTATIDETGGIVLVGSNARAVFALDKHTGNLFNIYNTTAAVSSTPLVVGDGLYVTSQDCVLSHFDISNKGAEATWKYSCSGCSTISSPVSYPTSTNVFLSCDDRVYAIDAGTGAQVWQSTTLGNTATGLAVDSSTGMLFVGDAGSQLSALYSGTGIKAWSVSLDSHPIRSRPLFFESNNGKLVFAGSGPTLYAVSPESGNIIYNTSVDNSVRDTPFGLNETLYFESCGGILYAMKAATGHIQWVYSTGSSCGAPAKEPASFAYQNTAGEDIVVIAPTNYVAGIMKPTSTPVPTPVPTTVPTAAPPPFVDTQQGAIAIAVGVIAAIGVLAGVTVCCIGPGKVWGKIKEKCACCADGYAAVGS